MNLTYPTTLVLHALANGIRHGFDIIDATGLPSGTVYPILRRLEREALVVRRLGRRGDRPRRAAAAAALLRADRGRDGRARRRPRAIPRAALGHRPRPPPPAGVVVMIARIALRARAAHRRRRRRGSCPAATRAEWPREWDAELHIRSRAAAAAASILWRTTMDLIPSRARLDSRCRVAPAAVHARRRGRARRRARACACCVKSPGFTAIALLDLRRRHRHRRRRSSASPMRSSCGRWSSRSPIA